MYVITPAGRAAWEGQDAAIPASYRRLLWSIDMQGASNAIREMALEHPPTLVQDWLKELHELGFVQSGGKPSADTTLPISTNEPAIQSASRAIDSLRETGAFFALRHRPSGRPKPAGKMQILIVEDDPDQRALADLRISMAGYGVRVAASVGDLLRSLRKDGTPDLLLLDVMLPDGNGFDVLAKLRRHPDYASLPIIMLTAERKPADIGRGLALGADGYVIKPYSKALITDVIARVVRP
jgi:two-component system, OmpR family, response regulator